LNGELGGDDPAGDKVVQRLGEAGSDGGPPVQLEGGHPGSNLHKTLENDNPIPPHIILTNQRPRVGSKQNPPPKLLQHTRRIVQRASYQADRRSEEVEWIGGDRPRRVEGRADLPYIRMDGAEGNWGLFLYM
jgi:hypothetical protein